LPSNKNTNEKEEVLSFEQIFTDLEDIVGRLEEGDLPLEESLRLFEQGIGLCRVGGKRLDVAEQRIEQLLRDPLTGEELRIPWKESKKED